MKRDDAVKKRQRRTVIYPSGKDRIAEQEFRDSLLLLEDILSAYGSAMARYARVLQSNGSDDEDQARCRPP